VDLNRTVTGGEAAAVTVDEKELAARIARNIDSTLERITPAATPDQEALIRAAREARPRMAGSREDRVAERTGVAGLSLGHGPLPIEELERIKRQQSENRES